MANSVMPYRSSRTVPLIRSHFSSTDIGKAADPLTINRVALQPARAAAIPATPNNSLKSQIRRRRAGTNQSVVHSFVTNSLRWCHILTGGVAFALHLLISLNQLRVDCRHTHEYADPRLLEHVADT